MLKDLPEFEIYSAHFKSIDHPANEINILYQTNESNCHEGITSPYDSFFVGVLIYAYEQPYLRLFGIVYVYDMREGTSMSAVEKMFTVV